MSQTDMTAIAVEGGKGSAADMKPVRLPRPEAGPGQILIKVAHAGVNRPDLIQRMGFYPPPPGSPDTMGLEVSGEVVVGAGRWKAGDQVTALLGGGGYAEYAVVAARHALPNLQDHRLDRDRRLRQRGSERVRQGRMGPGEIHRLRLRLRHRPHHHAQVRDTGYRAFDEE